LKNKTQNPAWREKKNTANGQEKKTKGSEGAQITMLTNTVP